MQEWSKVFGVSVQEETEKHQINLATELSCELLRILFH